MSVNRIVIEPAKELAPGIYYGELALQIRRALDSSDSASYFGEVSMVGCANPVFRAGRLEFDLDDKLLLEGVTEKTLFTRMVGAGSPPPDDAPARTYRADDRFPKGVVGYLSEVQEVTPHLIEPMQKLMQQLLDAGKFDLAEPSGSAQRWVAKPSNFFSSKVQRTAKNLQVTVFGKPENYVGMRGSLDIRRDRASYARFWIQTPRQAQEALPVISLARELARRKRGR